MNTKKGSISIKQLFHSINRSILYGSWAFERGRERELFFLHLHQRNLSPWLLLSSEMTTDANQTVTEPFYDLWLTFNKISLLPCTRTVLFIYTWRRVCSLTLRSNRKGFRPENHHKLPNLCVCACVSVYFVSHASL